MRVKTQKHFAVFGKKKKEKKDVYITTYIQVEIVVCVISCNEARFI